MAWDIPKISMRPLGSHGYEFSSAFSVNEPRRHPEWHSDSLGPASKRAPDRQTTFPRPELRQCVGEAAGPPDRDSGSRFDASEVGFARVLLPGVEHCGSGGGEGRPDAVSSGHGLPAPSVDAEHDVLAMGRDRNCDGKAHRHQIPASRPDEAHCHAASRLPYPKTARYAAGAIRTRRRDSFANSGRRARQRQAFVPPSTVRLAPVM